MKYGRTETGEKIKDSKWLRQQLRLTADFRLPYVLTTGASQVSKSLGNYLVCIDTLINGQLSIGWFFASRSSMNNQQPGQFQAMVKYWVKSLETKPEIGRDSVSRYTVGIATGNFSYANSASGEKTGGATEGKEAASFSASVVWEEEKSSWKTAIDVTPRLGASKLRAKPRRALGTPGAGAGIERDIRDASHNFVPGLVCPACKNLTFLDPKLCLLKPVKNERTKKNRWFNARGEILGFYSKDGTYKTAYIACMHCHEEIKPELIKDCQLHSKQTGETVDQFLDNLPEDEIYFDSVSIYLSPLLRVPDDPLRVQELIKEGLDPENPSIYQQNKLGHSSETANTGVSIEEYEFLLSLKPHSISDRGKVRVAGIDQGRDTFYMVILEYYPNTPDDINIVLSQTISYDQVLSQIEYHKVDLCVIDNEPDRLSANDLVKNSKGKLVMADQREIMTDFSLIKVKHGEIELDCYAINNSLFKEVLSYRFTNLEYRFLSTPHRRFMKHVTSVRKDLDTGKWERPADHDDDFFFALQFAESAKTLYTSLKKKTRSSSFVGSPLTTYKI